MMMKTLAFIFGFLVLVCGAVAQTERCDDAFKAGDWLEAMSCYANAIKADPDNAVYPDAMKERSFMLYTNVLQYEKCSFENGLVNFRNEAANSVAARKYADAIALMLRIDSVKTFRLDGDVFQLSDSLARIGVPIPPCFESQINWDNMKGILESMLVNLALDSAEAFLNKYPLLPTASTYGIRILNYRKILSQEASKNYTYCILMIEEIVGWANDMGLVKLHRRISLAQKALEQCHLLLQQGNNLFGEGDVVKAKGCFEASLALGECNDDAKTALNRCNEMLEALTKYQLIDTEKCAIDYSTCKGTFEKYRFSCNLADQLYGKIQAAESTETKRQQLLRLGMDALCKQSFAEAQKFFAEASTLCQYDNQVANYLKITKELKGAIQSMHLANYDIALPVMEQYKTICPFCEYYAAKCYATSRKKMNLIKAGESMSSAASRGHEQSSMELPDFKKYVKNAYGQTGVQFDFIVALESPSTNILSTKPNQVVYNFSKLGSPGLGAFFPLGFQIRYFNGNEPLNFSFGGRYLDHSFEYKSNTYAVQTFRFPVSLILHSANSKNTFSRTKPYQGLRFTSSAGFTFDLNSSESPEIRSSVFGTNFSIGFELGGRCGFLSLLLEKQLAFSNLFVLDSPLFDDGIKYRSLGMTMILRPW